MALISLRNVSIGFGGATVLDQVSLSIQPGARTCVTGRNGEGKSTLLKILAGILLPDTGEVIKDSGVRVALLPQDVPEDRPGSVREIIEAHVTAQHDAHTPGASAVITQLELDPDVAFNTLSGGLRRRVLLGCALVASPQLLLLDEPTNHLDIDSIQWLERWLARATCACLFITHDRAFLKHVAKSVFDLDRGQLSGWECDYSTFLRRKQELLADEAVYWTRLAKKLSEEEIWLRRGVKARTCRNEGRVAALMQLRETFAQRRDPVGTSKLTLGQSESSGDLVFKLEHVSFGYQPDKPLVKDLSLRILRGERIGIIGANGSGKTTLLKLLLDKLTPTEGTITRGTRLQPAFFDQLRDALNPEASVLDNVAEGKDFVTIGGIRKHIFGYLQDFLFTPERARTPVKALSGGERARLLLARLFLNPGNLLILDEPTNDLDVETLELLEEQLAQYKGTILLVSHDRDFLDSVATSTLVMEQGTVTLNPGGYTEWFERKAALAKAAAQVAAAEKIASKDDEKTKPVMRPKSDRLGYRDQQRLKELPGIIEKLEQEIAALNDKINAPTPDYLRSPQYTQDLERLTAASAQLDENFEAYCELEERAAKAGA